ILEHFGVIALDVDRRGEHPRTHVVVREDHRKLLEHLVAAHVIPVVMRVDQELDRFAGDALDLIHDAGGNVLELGIDDENRVRAHEEADIAAAAMKSVDIPTERFQLEDFVGLSVVVLGGRGCLRGNCLRQRRRGIYVGKTGSDKNAQGSPNLHAPSLRARLYPERFQRVAEVSRNEALLAPLLRLRYTRLVRPVSNPPNPWESVHAEFPGEPPMAKLQVFEETSRSIIAENDSPDVGFRFSVNPYRGCFHSCAYCLSGDTPILMADGRTRPIAEVRVGDEIYGTEKCGRYRHYAKT